MMTFTLETLLNYLNTAVFWFGTIVAAASVIVKATPSQKDDAVLAKIVKILEYISVFNADIRKTGDQADETR